MNGVYTQMSTSITVNRAVEGDDAHWKFSSPTSEANQLSTPKLTLVISFHISAANAGAVISGISKEDRDQVVQPRAPLQQERDAEPEQELEHHGQARVDERHLEGLPEGGVGQEVPVVLPPVHLPRPRLAEAVACCRE